MHYKWRENVEIPGVLVSVMSNSRPPPRNRPSIHILQTFVFFAQVLARMLRLGNCTCDTVVFFPFVFAMPHERPAKWGDRLDTHRQSFRCSGLRAVACTSTYAGGYCSSIAWQVVMSTVSLGSSTMSTIYSSAIGYIQVSGHVKSDHDFPCQW